MEQADNLTPAQKSTDPEPFRLPGPISKKATIVWLNDKGEGGTEEEAPRSLAYLRDYLRELAIQSHDAGQRRLQIIVKPETKDPEELKQWKLPTGEDIVLQIAGGTLDEVVKALDERVLQPQQVLIQIQATLAQLFDLSELKGAIITLVSGDGYAGGFGLLSSTNIVTDTDVVTLGMAAANQAKLYRDNMEKKGYKFPEEPGSHGRIIVPGR